MEAVVLGERDAEVHPRAGDVGGVVRDVQLARVGLLVAREEPAADPFRPEVGIGVGDPVLLLAAAVVERERGRVAGPEQVLLGDAHVEERPPVLRVAGAEEQRPGGALGDVDDDVHLVGGPGHGLGLDPDLVEVTELEEPLARAVEVPVDHPGAFELAHLASQDLVAGLVVAAELDPPHVHALAGVHEERDVHLPLFLADLGDRVHVGEGVALVAETVLDARGGRGHVAAVEDVPLAHFDEVQELLGRDDEIARELDRADLEGLSLRDVDGDVDEALVGGDGNLGGVDREVDETPVEVVGAKAFQVTGHLLPRVAVRARQPGEEGPGRGIEEIEEIVLVEGPVADDVDMPDPRHLALVDIEVNAHPMALERRHRRLDLGGVAPLREVGLADLPLRPVQDRGIEDAADREPHPAERFEQILGLELVVAGKVDVRDGGPLLHDHDHRAAVALDPHVVEEAGREQPPDGLRGVPGGGHVAHRDWQLVENRAGGDTPESLHPDVLDDERLPEGDGRQDRQQAYRGETPEHAGTHQLNSLMTSL